MPTKTPVALPDRPSVASPALSSASCAVSSSRRCCGSIVAASRGEMPKNCGSNRSTWREEAATPRDHLARRLRIRIVVRRRRPSDPAGTSVTASTPSRTTRHSASGVLDPAGVAAAGADDGDRLVSRALAGVEAGLEPLDGGQRFLQKIPALAHGFATAARTALARVQVQSAAPPTRQAPPHARNPGIRFASTALAPIVRAT